MQRIKYALIYSFVAIASTYGLAYLHTEVLNAGQRSPALKEKISENYGKAGMNLAVLGCLLAMTRKES